MKKILISFIITFFWISPVYTEDIQKEIFQHYQLGNNYYQQGKYKEAQTEFQKALDLSAKEEIPKKPEVSKEIEEIVKAEEERVTLEYKETDLAQVLRSLSLSYELNIVPPPEIKGKVTVSLKDVKLEEALEAILMSCGYSYYKKGNLIYIYPFLKPEDIGLITLSFPLNYLTAAEAEALVSKSLSPRGDIRINEATNSLVIRDYVPVLDKIDSLIKEIDKPSFQVLIEAKIIDITSKDLRNLGVTYSATYTAPGGLFKHRDSAYEDTIRETPDQVKGTVTLPGPSASIGGGQFKLDTFIIKNFDVIATIDALIQDNKANLLASPSIATLNGKEARIIIGEKVPYKEKTQTTTGTTETTRFIDVGTTLRVIPPDKPGWLHYYVRPS